MKRMALVCITVVMAAFSCPPKAHAIDPITMAILAPIAVKAAEVAKPYVIRAAVNTGAGLFKVGKDVFEILYLPYGLGEITIGAPFHRFRRGVVHIVRGGVVAPTRLFLHVMLMPLYMVGAKVNI